MRTTILLSGILIVTGVAVSAAQRTAKPSEGCALLTEADIGAAVGGAAGRPHDTVMGGPGTRTCMWGPTAGEGMVTYSIFSAVHGPQREQGLAKLRQVTETLKSRGWKEDKKAFSGASCSMLTPPASEKDSPAVTGCIAEAKGVAISISYTGKKGLSIDNVKALLDKLVARLP